MRLLTRSQPNDFITEVDLGTVMAIVKIQLDGGNQVFTSSVTKDATVELGLAFGQSATVFIKSTEITIGVNELPTWRRPCAPSASVRTLKVTPKDFPIPEPRSDETLSKGSFLRDLPSGPKSDEWNIFDQNTGGDARPRSVRHH